MLFCISHKVDQLIVKDAKFTVKIRNIFTDNFFVHFPFGAQISSDEPPHHDHTGRRRVLVAERRKTLPDANDTKLAVEGLGGGYELSRM